jgi:hypothetical protein
MATVTYAEIQSVNKELDRVQLHKLGLSEEVNNLRSYALAARVEQLHQGEAVSYGRAQ